MKTRKKLSLPAPTPESEAVAAMLDKAAAGYAAISGENYRARKAEYFEKCREFASTLYKEKGVILYAGDCDFDSLHASIGEDKEHLAAIIVFCTDAEHFYEMGVCVRSTPLFKRINAGKAEADKAACTRWGRLGVYFED
ncbi:MAG: hypothetical protein IJW21_09190 [Clostridia bacterium]|nr:hypothetical protein [Clostridia bacterium]